MKGGAAGAGGSQAVIDARSTDAQTDGGASRAKLTAECGEGGRHADDE